MAAPLSQLPSQEAARVDDYLNDKIQSASDLDGLDSLLANLRAQHELQQKQLAEAQEALAKATKASNDHCDAVRKQVEAFNRQQADIDRRLKIITQSETSDDAVRIFESSMEKLRRLDVAKGYLALLRDVEQLSKEATTHSKSAPKTAVSAYARLRRTAFALKDAQVRAEGAAPHLVDHTENLALAVKQQLQADFSEQLQGALEKLKWPRKDLVLNEEYLREWETWVDLLLDLQEPELAVRSSGQDNEPPILLPLQVMVHPLELRFKYHFSGNKPTNRLDKPEYFLSHVSDLISTYAGFISTYLQPIFDRRADAVGADLEWHFVNATNGFITALFSMVRQKISTFVPQVAGNPQLLSHFIHELMNFDTDIRDTWGYLPDPYSPDQWRGLAWEVLTKGNWFDRWLQVEKDFALARYKDIIDTSDSGHIDYDGVEPNTTKPTKAAIRVNDLLETITDRYRPLSSFSQKLRFLIDVQITIFDQFHERLHSGLEAYLAMTSAIGRTVQGADAQGSLEGVAGLERLCRIFGSAEYLEKKMQDWSDDVFFLELWNELQERVRKNTSGGKNVVGPMSVAEVAERTSQAVAETFSNGPKQPSATTADGALFDETASAYRRLRQRSENIIISTFSSEVQSALKPYTRVSTWSSLSAPAASNYPHPPTPDLTSAIRVLSANATFLAGALGSAPLHRIIRNVLLSVQSYLWDNVLLRHTFSTAGASQLASDVEHICSVVDSALGHHHNYASSFSSRRVMRKLGDGLTLLCLRISPQSGPVEQDSNVLVAEKALGLWEAEKRLFANNESAREVLAELELDNLTEAEARAVLERRVEVRS